MDDLISRQALLDAFDEFEPGEECEYEHDMWMDMRMDVIHAPSIEATPVRRGKWVQKPVMVRTPNAKNYTCSVCGGDDYGKNYCPNCGADMREVKHG